MENYFREKLKLRSTPLFIDFLESENPYKDKPNLLSDRQKKKRKRLIKRNLFLFFFCLSLNKLGLSL